MVAAAQKAAPKFHASNTEDITTKPEGVQALWRILSKMDPAGELFVNDQGVVSLAGEVPEARLPTTLGFTDEEINLIDPYGVYDGAEMDNPKAATGVLFTTYQLIELAYDLGREDTAAGVTKSITNAVKTDDDDDEDLDADEDFDDEEDALGEAVEDDED